MNERVRNMSRSRAAVFHLGLALLLSFGIAHAESAKDAVSSTLLPPPAQEDQSVLTRRLQTAKRDIETFRIFAENFRGNSDAKSLAQLQNPVDEFLKKHVDNLLAQGVENSTLETTRLTAEIMFIKTRLFLSLNRRDAARNTVDEMKKRFGSYQKISVDLPGKTTTLDEGIRLLDEELAKIPSAEKK
jgi:hypothetical protein